MPTISMYVQAHTSVLLQTAKATVLNCDNLECPPTSEIRAVFDLGSQRTFVTAQTRDVFSLRTVRFKPIVIKTFGLQDGQREICEVVDLGLLTSNAGHLKLTAIVVPHICDPICTQSVTLSKQSNALPSTLDLADAADVQDNLEIDLLIGSDQYWDLVTGKI